MLSCFILRLGFLVYIFVKVKEKLKTLALVTSICGLIILAFPVYVQDTLLLVQDQISSISNISDRSNDFGSTVRPNLIKKRNYTYRPISWLWCRAGNAEYYMDHYKIYPTGGITNVHNWWRKLL
jgi:hypothetical protein